MANYVELETELVNEWTNNDFIRNGSQIDIEESRLLEHYSITNTKLHTNIIKDPERLVDPIYEYKLIDDYNKYLIKEINIDYDYKICYYGQYDMKVEKLIEGLEILNRFNLMRTPDENIIEEYEIKNIPPDIKEEYEIKLIEVDRNITVEASYMPNHYNYKIYVTNYGKILIIGIHDNSIALYDLNFKIDSEYYNTIYYIKYNANTKDKILRELCSFIEELKRFLIKSELEEVIQVDGINNVIMSYLI
jgi:hypothetical protein